MCGSGLGHNRKDQLPAGRKLGPLPGSLDKTVSFTSRIVREVSQDILIAFDDATTSLLRYQLELPSNNETADLLYTLGRSFRFPQAMEKVMDAVSPGFFRRLFLIPKLDGFFRPFMDLEKLISS